MLAAKKTYHSNEMLTDVAGSNFLFLFKHVSELQISVNMRSFLQENLLLDQYFDGERCEIAAENTKFHVADPVLK
jgi:hypothetical protein